MIQSLIVSGADCATLLSQRIAGLSLFERIRRSAARAGIPQVHLICPEPHSGHPALPHGIVLEDPERLVADPAERHILLECGYFPDVDLLVWLDSIRPEDLPAYLEERPHILVVRGDQVREAAGRLIQGATLSDLALQLGAASGLRHMPMERGRLLDASSPTAIRKAEKALFRSLIKDTEGFMSKHVERPISLAISKRLVETSLTPNQMSLISIFVGLIGALLMSWPDRFWPICGALLFLFHSILDGCDGELARIKFMESRLGGVIDFWGDNVVHAAVFIGIARHWSATKPGLWPQVMAVLATAGGLASAALVYWQTMRSKNAVEPQFTSVVKDHQASSLSRVADALSRRDFIYLVVILAIMGKLEWFLMASAVGAPAFFAALVWIHTRESKAPNL